LLAVLQPDTRQPDKDVADFAAIRRFGEIMPARLMASTREYTPATIGS
jgi:hypothetical protein